MRMTRLWPVLAGMLVGFLWAGSASAQGNGAVILSWTAVGDDSLTGTATRYDIRYSLFPITESNFIYCQGPTTLPLPAAPGTPQRVTVLGLLPGLRYYFAMKTADERLNWSRISNVVAYAEQSVGVGMPALRLEFAAPVPNPARSSTGFSYGMPEAGSMSVDIFDVQGRYVRTLINQWMPPGSGLLSWDLKDYGGGHVAPGAYLARAKLGSNEFTRRIIVTR